MERIEPGPGWCTLPAGPERRIGVNQAWCRGEADRPWRVETVPREGEPDRPQVLTVRAFATVGDCWSLDGTGDDGKPYARVCTNGAVRVLLS